MKEATDRRDTFNTSPGESEASQQSGGPQWGGGGGDGMGGVGGMGWEGWGCGGPILPHPPPTQFTNFKGRNSAPFYLLAS